jgi:hypothetical protein
MITVLPSCATDGAENVVPLAPTRWPRQVVVPDWFQ